MIYISKSVLFNKNKWIQYPEAKIVTLQNQEIRAVV